MRKQLVFIDDSGDPGFKDGTNNSNLVMAAAVFIDPAEATLVNGEISEFRRSLGWREEHEFKFRKAPKVVKVRFLEIVSRYDFEVYAVFIDKGRCSTAFRISDYKKLYDWTTKELLRMIPMNEALVKVEGGLRRKQKLKVKSNIRKEINTAEYKIRRIEPRNSSRDNLIQMTDMIAGSIHRSLQPDKADAQVYMRIIKRKVKKLKALDLR